MLEHLPADEGTAEVEEGIVQRRVALVAHQEAAVAVLPGEAAFDHPAVASKPLAGLAAAAGDPRGDAPAAESGAVAAGRVPQVRVQFTGPSPRPAAAATGRLERGDSVHQAFQYGALVHVGRGAEGGQRGALPIDYQMVGGPRLAPVGRIGPSRSAPFLTPLAGIREASALAR